MSKKLRIDFETRSKVDIKKHGSWVYSLDPSTDVLCMSFKLDDHDVRLWKPDSVFNIDALKKLVSECEIEAHNAFFERCIWENIMVKRYGWPEIKPNQWRCSAALAAYHAIPRALDKAGEALGLSSVKSQDGKRVMMQLTKPKAKTGEFYEEKTDTEKFNILYEYCKQDVDAEFALSQALGELPEQELRVWQLNEKINYRGIPMDREAIEAANLTLARVVETLKKEAIEIFQSSSEIKTNIDINKRAKVLVWCAEQGEVVENYTKDGIKEALKKVKNPKVKRILQLRQATGKTSTAKYQAMLDCLPADNRIRDTLMYHGAQTGRFSGRKVQFHNLPRGNVKIDSMEMAVECIKTGDEKLIEFCYGDYMQFMSSAIRGMMRAEDGKKLMVADFAAIEARVLAWLSGCELMMQQFRDGVDLYKDMAAKIYNIDVKDVTNDQRQLGKQAILGAGYGMGAPKFMQTCLGYGMNVDEELAALAINTYRATYPEVKNFWYAMERKAISTTLTKTHNCYQINGRSFLTWHYENNFLKCELPTNRNLHYYKARIIDKQTSWGEVKPALVYVGEKAGKSGGKSWNEVDTYGGKLVENVTQAVARDLMVEAMLRIEEAGFPIILSVHDELIVEVDENRADLAKFLKLMVAVPSWAAGCPIKAEGWVGKYYKK